MSNRNQPCSCGSGLKFKRCCGNEAVRCEKRRAELAADLENMRAGIARREQQEKEARERGEPPPRRKRGMLSMLPMLALLSASFDHRTK